MTYLISQNLKYLRRKHGLTFLDIEQKTSINKSTVASYEYGKAKPKEEAVAKLAEFFKVEPQDLTYKNIAKMDTGNVNVRADSKGGKDSVINQIVNDPSEIFHLKEKITMLERIIDEKQKRIELLEKNVKSYS